MLLLKEKKKREERKRKKMRIKIKSKRKMVCWSTIYTDKLILFESQCISY